MSVKKNIAIVVDDFALGSPAQQILDRFLIGFTHDGVFEARPFEKVTICSSRVDNKLLEERKSKFSLNFARTCAEAVGSADAVIFLAQEGLNGVIENVREGTPLFVYGLLAKTEKEAKGVVRKAEARKIRICAGTVMATLMQLPPMEIPAMRGIGAQIREALIVTQGRAPDAELAAFDAVASVLEPHGGVQNIKKVRALEGNAVWDSGNKEWSWRLLASALSRTDNPQGNTALDGRTEDILGLHLAQKMATNPRARIIEHSGGLRTTIMVLDGVVTDLLVAVRAGRRLMPGSIYSTQLFQAPKPQQEEYSRLVGALIEFFESGRPPWNTIRAFASAELNEKLQK